MDTERIVNKEGYRSVDLNVIHREVIRWLRFLENEFEEGFYHEVMTEEESLLQKMLIEIGEQVKKDAVEWIHNVINEIQISFAESEEDDDGSNR